MGIPATGSCGHSAAITNKIQSPKAHLLMLATLRSQLMPVFRPFPRLLRPSPPGTLRATALRADEVRQWKIGALPGMTDFQPRWDWFRELGRQRPQSQVGRFGHRRQNPVARAAASAGGREGAIERAASDRAGGRIRPGWWRRARVSHDTYSASPSPTPASRSGPTTLGCRQTGLFNVGRPDVLIGPDAFVSAAPSTTARPA